MPLWWRYFIFLLDTMILNRVLKKGTQLYPCRAQQKVTAIQMSLLPVPYGCSTCLSSSTTLGNSMKCLSSPHFLPLLRARGKLHATGHLVLPGFLLLINMSEKRDTTLDLEHEVGKFPTSFGTSCALGRQQIAAHAETSHLPHPALMLGMMVALCSSGSR